MPYDIEIAKKEALSHYNHQYKWFEHHKKVSMWGYYSLQGLSIILSGITPVLVIGLPDIKTLHALFPALSAIFTSLLATLKFHDTWISRGVAFERLKQEKLSYDTYHGSLYLSNLSEKRRLDNFIEQIRIICTEERTEWVSTRNKNDENDPKDTKDKTN